MKLRRLAMALAALAAGAIVYLSIRHSRPEPAAASAYVNPSLCANCHPAIAKSYKLTGMGRSFYRPRSENMTEDYQSHNTFYHAASDRHYTMSTRDGRWFERRHQTGFNGVETNIVEAQIDYVMGSGAHARTYLHRTSEGKLVELPITWYAENGGYWEMSPGYSRPDHSDFRRAISYECMACHNAYPTSSPSGSDTVFPNDLPEGIDCQRCHGPGSAHVRAATANNPTPASIRQSIVNPARLPRDRQLDVCAQCHLQTTSLRSPDSIRRYDHPPFSYQPGQVLEDNTVHLEFAGTDTFEIDHAAYRLAQSKCFIRSQMTCTTCHNPHSSPEASQVAAHYVAVCQSCHSTPHPSSVITTGKTCLDCHMPKRRTQDVVHAVMTDHYIQRNKPNSDLLAPLKEIHPANTGAVTLYRTAASTDAELYRAVAEAQQHHPAALESAIERQHPSQPEFDFELGRSFIKSGETEKGIRWLEESLKIRPDFSPALKQLGAALSDAGQFSHAAEVLEKVSTPDADALTDLGNVYLHQGNLDAAQQDLLRAVTVNPELPAAHNLMGLALLRKGDPVKAEASFREAIRIQPDLAEAQTNLGNLLAGTGDLRQAIFHLEKAVAGDPDSVDAHYNLGQAYAASGAFSKAQGEFETTVRLKPSFAAGHSDLGRLLAMQGRQQQASDEFRRALQIDPNLAEAHYELGDLLAAKRNIDEAAQQFRLAILSDANFYAAHFALARILRAKGELQEAALHFEKASQSPDPRLREAVSHFK